MDITTFGSYVALGLAGLKVLEFSRDRKPKIYVEKIFRGVADLGHDLILLNSSKVPANVYYYDLIWVKPSFLTKCFGFRRKIVSHEFSMEDNTCDIRIDGQSQAVINFSDERYFATGAAVKDDLYLKMFMAGRRRPLWIWITGPRD
jgi:hypothetical protein